ncbi:MULTISPECIES: 4-oxalocrotonate tautomerase family protein [unclassified Acinetobacter]|uniref:tautomerase family protein n=1 Tax=unclassified Acinetobacter TaxID=196816 RepID=UPI00244AAE7D|nr:MULTISPECIES: 4-oxalocrotonate tautomerase family protein [unclassified Acinetobacter]MDH0031276.1 4-oxalocrotonate tautomerase family protein [Acinetobacter sp. GD04021]MDH0887021.1 4-oxalocrotonate tautomerase family protein [Acinetobacter sp. GD03873]MDH1083472.1 4-oxalocrotonate tautomerase family protein [Acinetobacter sp. GD03983]MDH2190337.1 4-oxalocrotonate tautomerase family protein [Acinetobacter sp. GD03645]MDH2203720.1 4-oxalocrotonate tautomerase family protein [Acinetobacter s
MPYILIQVTKENVSVQQKQQLIKEATELVVRVLDKDPATTFVVIDEVDTDNWGVAGESVSMLRQKQSIKVGDGIG